MDLVVCRLIAINTDHIVHLTKLAIQTKAIFDTKIENYLFDKCHGDGHKTINVARAGGPEDSYVLKFKHYDLDLFLSTETKTRISR